jgi:hypothetical protein
VVGLVKRVHLTQAYELIVTIEVDVPDDHDHDDLYGSLVDFPINATVESMWDNDFEGTDIAVGGVTIDSLVCLNGSGATIFTDENGDIISQSV